MGTDTAAKLVEINPYAMGFILVVTLGACLALGRVIVWLVKYIINRHESENATIITDLKDAIENLTTTQQTSSTEMREALHEMSMSAQLMATTLREKIDDTAGKIHARIDKTKKDLDTRIDEVHDRVSAGNEERGALAADVATIKGRCDDRARMCPHVRGGQHCHPDLCVPVA